jgi:hypothetical protein
MKQHKNLPNGSKVIKGQHTDGQTGRKLNSLVRHAIAQNYRFVQHLSKFWSG